MVSEENNLEGLYDNLFVHLRSLLMVHVYLFLQPIYMMVGYSILEVFLFNGHPLTRVCLMGCIIGIDFRAHYTIYYGKFDSICRFGVFLNLS